MEQMNMLRKIINFMDLNITVNETFNADYTIGDWTMNHTWE